MKLAKKAFILSNGRRFRFAFAKSVKEAEAAVNKIEGGFKVIEHIKTANMEKEHIIFETEIHKYYWPSEIAGLHNSKNGGIVLLITAY